MAYVGPFAVIIPTGVKLNGSDVFNILDPDSGGAGTFSVPLSVDGVGPATHWGARTFLEADTHNALTSMTTTQFKAYVDAKQVERGRKAVGSVTAFKNAILISPPEANFWEFVTANGLKRVAESI